jgi:outer membrane protein
VIQRNWKAVALALVALALSSPASAQLKVAVINAQRAVLETAEMKKAAADLEAKYRPVQQEIEKRTKELQEIQAKVADPSKITPQQNADLQAQGQMKQRQLQRMTEDLQADVDRDRNEILARGSQRMNEVVAKLAEEKGLDLVVDAADTIFFKPAMEITNEAIAAYDKTHPVKP